MDIKFILVLVCVYPLYFSPKGEKKATPSPLGEGWEEGLLIRI